jgi:hypothetical protein
MPVDDTLDTCVSVYRASWYENTYHDTRYKLVAKDKGLRKKILNN